MNLVYTNPLVTVTAVVSFNSTVPFLGDKTPTERWGYRSLPLCASVAMFLSNFNPIMRYLELDTWQSLRGAAFTGRPVDPTVS